MIGEYSLGDMINGFFQLAWQKNTHRLENKTEFGLVESETRVPCDFPLCFLGGITAVVIHLDIQSAIMSILPPCHAFYHLATSINTSSQFRMHNNDNHQKISREQWTIWEIDRKVLILRDEEAVIVSATPLLIYPNKWPIIAKKKYLTWITTYFYRIRTTILKTW
jgi:hypothetical protein